MRDAADYLHMLSGPELALYFGLFGEYPTTDREQRARLAAAVKAHARETPKAPEPLPAPVLTVAPLVRVPKPVERRPHRRKGRAPKSVEEADNGGNWWASAIEAAAALGLSPQRIRQACCGVCLIGGRELVYSKRRTRPGRAKCAA